MQTRVGGRLSAVVDLFTVATLTVIGFVSAGLVTFSQAVRVIVGATFGTISTPWLKEVSSPNPVLADAALDPKR
jgi:phosphate:Na+ symporter